jgi:hypothetical protein
MTLSIDDFRLPPALHIGSRGGLYMIWGGFSMAEMAPPAGGPSVAGTSPKAQPAPSRRHILRLSARAMG